MIDDLITVIASITVGYFISLYFHHVLDKNPFCKWNNISRKYTYDKNRSGIINTFFDVIYKSKINYFLGYGSELGSYRNNGLIKKDHDVDILIPIWMNYHIFKCKNYIRYKRNKCKIYTSPKFLLCNKTRYDYLMILKNHIQNIIKTKFDYRCRNWGKYGYTSCWMLYSKNLFLDVWVLLGNEYVYHDIEICKCKFSERIAYCNKNTINNIIRLYGDNYMIPNKKGDGEIACKIIIYPNKNNSILMIQ